MGKVKSNIAKKLLKEIRKVDKALIGAKRKDKKRLLKLKIELILAYIFMYELDKGEMI